MSNYRYVEPIEVADNVIAIDYTREKRCWGYDFTVMSVLVDRIGAAGWGLGMEKGDLVVLDDMIFKVLEVKYEENPRDMWKAIMLRVWDEEIAHLSEIRSGVEPMQGSPCPTMSAEITNYVLTSTCQE